MNRALHFSQTSLDHFKGLLEHPQAPSFNFESTDLLDSDSLADVQRFAAEGLLDNFWEPGHLPDWMPDFLARVFQEVPHYRDFGGVARNFEALPTIGRAELKETAERLIPDSVSTEQLTVYVTSGTSGTAIPIPTDPGVSSKVLVLMDKMLSAHGLQLSRGPGQLAVAALFCQESTLTYPSLSHYLEGAATLKLNLHPQGGWRDPDDRQQYLESLGACVVTGCPYSLAVLTDLCPELRPLAIMSSAMPLGDGLRGRLSEVFECPIFDVYSLTEAKFIAADHGKGCHDLLSPDLYVEILDSTGRALPPGERGEITITGGRNFCLPLVRYRTGDYGALGYRGRQPFLLDFEGREPVVLTRADGQRMSTLDVVHLLQDLPLVGFSYHQTADGFRFSYFGEVSDAELLERLENLTGRKGEVLKADDWAGKPHSFGVEH